MTTSSARQLVGASIRTRRQMLGLSQEALAERAGLQRTYVSEVESGKRNITIDRLAIFAAALRCSLPDLFSPSPQ